MNTTTKRLTRLERGLGKYDAPLRMQYDKGYADFNKGRVGNPFAEDTMQYREWERGFNTAYYDQLKRVQQYDIRGRG